MRHLIPLLAAAALVLSTAPAYADLDGDGSVGTFDLTILLGAWGPCCEVAERTPPQTVQECIDKFCCKSERQLALQKCLCVVDPQSCE